MPLAPDPVEAFRATLAVPLRPLEVPCVWQDYPLTPPQRVYERIGDAAAVIHRLV